MKISAVTSVVVLIGFPSTNGYSIAGRSSSSSSSLSSLPLPAPKILQGKSATSHQSTIAFPYSRKLGSVLFANSPQSDEGPIVSSRRSKLQFARTLRRIILKAHTRLFISWSKIRRSFHILCASLIIWLGVAGIISSPSHASSIAAVNPPSSPNISRSIGNPSLDRIRENYVQKHMFDDDVYDPVESTYREGVDDKVKGTHPKALKEITATVLGQDVVRAQKKASGSGFVGNTLLKVVDLLRDRGLSEIQAIALLTGSFALGAPFLFFMVAMQVGLQNRRSINRLMKKRYGDTYSVDATIKEDDDVVLPDDSDDEDDEEEEEDDDDE